MIDEIRGAVRELCARFPAEYWRGLEPDGYPEGFVRALTDAGWLAALVPERYGGGGLGIAEAAVVLEEVNASGGNAAAAHAQMYVMGTLLRHGTGEQKERWLPRIAAGELRLQAFGVTEPNAGSDTRRIETRADRDGDAWRIRGQKVFTSRAEHSDLMLVLARSENGLSTFLCELPQPEIRIRPLATMMNHATTEVFLDGARGELVGVEGEGFRQIVDGWNAERILIAAECVGDGRWFVEKAAAYASRREVFGRPIGANQGVQFPIARAHVAVEAADLMRRRAAELFDAGEPCGPEANMAKLLASDASWAAANACIDVHGGWGFAREVDVERKFRETRLYQVAPVANNLVLAYLGHNVLGMPRSY
ncbi:MAG TPA: acyl-CoA dehydrogenase family protein [Gaiellaceae bacterium]|nr:acyl-CoA dehydrogenase family protein [Gaiellaceae bacterium]